MLNLFALRLQSSVRCSLLQVRAYSVAVMGAGTCSTSAARLTTISKSYAKSKRNGSNASECHEIVNYGKNDVESLQDFALKRQQNEEECFMLSLDGGGFRGLVLFEVLLAIEKRRKMLYPTAPHILAKFNWITGNSAGGIVALAFAAAKTDADMKLPALDLQSHALSEVDRQTMCCNMFNDVLFQCRNLFFDLREETDKSKPPYPNEEINKVFEKAFMSKKMSDINRDIVKVCVMTTLTTQNPPILHIMKNYGGSCNEQDPPDKQLVWKAARATSSVPMIFHPQDNKYLDGGIIANNPTTDAIIDMLEYSKRENEKLNLKMVLSIGCGFNEPTKIHDIDTNTPNRLVRFIGRLIEKLFRIQSICMKLWPWNLPLILHNYKTTSKYLEILFEQVTQPNGRVQKRSQFITEMLHARYFRINPGPLKHIDNAALVANINHKALSDMLYEVQLYMCKNCEEVVDPILHYIYSRHHSY